MGYSYVLFAIRLTWGLFVTKFSYQSLLAPPIPSQATRTQTTVGETVLIKK